MYIMSHVVGNDCGKVVVWNMAPVRDERDEKDENVPKLLCQMENHLGKGFP
jgi:protein HIRA/HIR1